METNTKTTTIRVLMLTLCLHLLYTNSELLIAVQDANPDGCTTFDRVSLPIFALTYSVISALCVFHVRRFLPVLLFALLDGFAVYLRINVFQEHFVFITSLFFGFYTTAMILVCFVISKQNRNQNETTIPENENQNQNQLRKNEITNDESKNETENQSESDLLFAESKTETTIKQLVCRLNPTKSEEKRLEIIREQKPEIQEYLLSKYKIVPSPANLGGNVPSADTLVGEPAAATTNPNREPTLF